METFKAENKEVQSSNCVRMYIRTIHILSVLGTFLS